MICLWQHLIKAGCFDCIEHKFPEPGHSFMDSDPDFAHVEQALSKHQNVYSVDQYQDITASCTRKNPFMITRMGGKFYSIKRLPDMLGLKNSLVNTDGEIVQFRDTVRWVKIDTFGEYQYKTSLDPNESWKRVMLKQSASAGMYNPNITPLLKSGQMKRGINAKKLADIHRQLPYIPDSFKGFYQSLVSEDVAKLPFYIC